MSTTDKTPADAALAEWIETTAQWRTSISTMQGKLVDARARIAEHESTRLTHALDAELGTKASITAMAKAHEEQAAAELRVADLEHAIAQAVPKLKEAEAHEAAARKAVDYEAAKVIISKRVACAAKIDAALATVAEHLVEYEKLWGELSSNSIHNGACQSVFDARHGLGRIKVAVPLMVQRAFDVRNATVVPLAKSEAETWAL
jgi:hypothetical protein